ncbi:MAG: dihydropteroate synthase [Candidatus Kariarchaeaceae archaeon]|jgi:dihydropteroate synthase
MKISGIHGGLNVGDEFDPIITGVINLSPESFYKDSIANEQIEKQVSQMILHGANIIDVGALSTRPISLYGGGVPTQVEELRRIEVKLPLIIEITESEKIPVSIDTQSSEVAELAIELGSKIVNDISGLKSDPHMAEVVAENNVDVVVMSTSVNPGDTCGFEQTKKALEDSIAIAQDAGIPRSKIVIDPAFGGWNGKSKKCDLELLRDFISLRTLHLPIYIGVSRKSTISTLDGGKTPEDRLVGSVILTNWLIEHGAHIIRTHDVKETVFGINVAKKLRKFNE